MKEHSVFRIPGWLIALLVIVPIIGIPCALFILRWNLLAESGVAVLERDVLPDGEIPGLERFDERKYGKAKFAFYRPV